jgi:hypothetical protein
MVEITRLDVDASRGRTRKASAGVVTVVVVGLDTDYALILSKAMFYAWFPKYKALFLTGGHVSYQP